MSRFITTSAAAEELGVDRGFLDRIAPLVHRDRPEVVLRIGAGSRRRHYRWLVDALPEAVRVGREQLVAHDAEEAESRAARAATGSSRRAAGRRKLCLRAVAREVTSK